jgi:Fe2+ transport system protein FeoA
MRKAPLGDPVEYAVMGSRVAIRRGDADLVIVREVD